MSAGANIGYLREACDNGKNITASCNKVAFEPFISFGFAAITEPKRGKIKMQNILIGPFISYNATNIFNLSSQSLHYFTFGPQLTGIPLEWD